MVFRSLVSIARVASLTLREALFFAVCITVPLGAVPQDERQPAAKPAALIELRVVDGVTGKPVEGAAVRRIDADPSKPPGSEVLPDEYDLAGLEQAFRVRPVIATTDAEGRARLERPASFAQITVEQGGRFGTENLWSAMNDSAEVKLFADPAVKVEVRDAAGRPVEGVSVALLCQEWGYWREVVHAFTGVDGGATLPHAGHAVHSTLAWSKDDVRWSLTIATCLATVVAHEWEGAPPAEPVKLVLPPTGSVDVLLEEADGTPVRAELQVALVAKENPWPRTENQRGPSDVLRGALRPWMGPAGGPGVMTSTALDGRACFEHVGLGVELVAGVIRNASSGVVTAAGRSSEKAGERSTLRFVLGGDAPSFSARVLDSAGQPLRGAEFLLSLFVRPPDAGWGFVNRAHDDVLGPTNLSRFSDLPVVRSDFDGRVRVDFESERALGGKPVLLIERGVGTPEHSVKVLEVAESWKPGAHDLGDVHLEPAPVIVAGRVVDDLDRPVEGAMVSIGEFKAPARITGLTDREGRFALRGVTFQKSIDLSFHKDGHASVWRNNESPGVSELSTVLPVSCEVRGKVRLPTGTTGRDFGLSLVRTDHTGPGEPAGVHGGLEDDGSFNRDGLPAGTYRLSVSRGGTWTSIYAKEGLVLTRDHPLDVGTIDLAGEAHPITLKIVDPDGKPLSGIYFLPDEPREENPVFPWADKDLWTSFDPEEFHDGALRLLPTKEVLRVDLAAAGFRIEHVEATTDREVRLRRGLPVRLALSKRVGDPPKGWELAVQLVSAAEKLPDRLHGRVPFESTAFDANGEATIVVPGPGKYWFEWELVKRFQGGHSARTWLDAHQRLEVVESEKEQRIVLAPLIDPGDFTLEELEKR